MRIRWTERASKDALGIFDFIADTNPYDTPSAKHDSESRRATARKPRSLLKRIAIATAMSLVALASGPLVWLVILVVFGAISGSPMQVFTDRITWEDEFIGKLPAALLLSSMGAIPAFIGILTDRTPHTAGDANRLPH